MIPGPKKANNGHKRTKLGVQNNENRDFHPFNPQNGSRSLRTDIKTSEHLSTHRTGVEALELTKTSEHLSTHRTGVEALELT